MMKNKIIADIENAQLNQDIPEFGPGDTLVVQVKVKEGTRERLQAFEGVVIAKRNRGINSAFTLRKISHGVGVDRPLFSFSITALQALSPRSKRGGIGSPKGREAWSF